MVGIIREFEILGVNSVFDWGKGHIFWTMQVNLEVLQTGWLKKSELHGICLNFFTLTLFSCVHTVSVHLLLVCLYVCASVKLHIWDDFFPFLLQWHLFQYLPERLVKYIIQNLHLHKTHLWMFSFYTHSVRFRLMLHLIGHYKIH